MRRNLAAGRPAGRVLAGQAMLLATGIGTVMSAGAGLASAAPLDDGPNAATAPATASPASSLPVGSPADAGTAPAADSPAPPVSGIDLVGDLLGGGKGADQASGSDSPGGATAEYNTGPESQKSQDPGEAGAASSD